MNERMKSAQKYTTNSTLKFQYFLGRGQPPQRLAPSFTA